MCACTHGVEIKLNQSNANHGRHDAVAVRSGPRWAAAERFQRTEWSGVRAALRGITRRAVILVAALQPFLVIPANAALTITGTRVIYHEASKSVIVPVTNLDNQPVLVQSWITNAQNEDDPAIPFAIAEPLFKVEPDRSSDVRIFYAGQGMPSDRESMMFLNIMGIPVKPTQQNTVQFAIKQRLKLFYRPNALSGSVSDAVAALRWQTKRDQIEVTNASPFHVSLIDLDLQWQGGHRAISDYLLLEPGATQAFDATVTHTVGPLRMRFVEINDVGLQVPHEVDLP